MNAKNLIAAVLALTVAGSAFADQNMTRVYTGQTRADVIATQQVQKIRTSVKTVASAAHSTHGQQAGE